MQSLPSNKHKNALTSCMLGTSALTILCTPCCYKFMSIDFLRLRFAETDTWSDHSSDSTKLSNLCSERSVSLLSTYLLLESPSVFFFFFLSLDSRLGGWQPHCWKFQPDPAAEARAEVDSTVAEAFYLEKLWCWRTCKQLTLQGFGFFRR